MSDEMNSFKINRKALQVGLPIITLVVILDQLSKEYVIEFFNNYFTSNYLQISSFFNIVLVWNKGVSFGLFSEIENSSMFFLAMSLFITCILLIWLAKAEKFVTYLSLGLIIGGALGNVADRIKHKAVADFLEFHYNDYYWPAFNFADSCISVGVIIMLIETIGEEMRGKKNV